MSRNSSKLALISLLGAVATMVSCVSTKEKPLAPSVALTAKSVLRTMRDKPSFGAMTAGKVAAGSIFGVVGSAVAGQAMISAGDRIVQTNGVEDPANWIGTELLAALQKKHGMRSIGERKVTGEDAAAIAQACSGADYALDVRTINWSFVYFPVNWATYRVIYSTKLRLIDCRTGKVVAEGFHARVPAKDAQSPGYDELVGNGAARLKQELRIGAEQALSHFQRDILKL